MDGQWIIFYLLILQGAILFSCAGYLGAKVRFMKEQVDSIEKVEKLLEDLKKKSSECTVLEARFREIEKKEIALNSELTKKNTECEKLNARIKRLKNSNEKLETEKTRFLALKELADYPKQLVQDLTRLEEENASLRSLIDLKYEALNTQLWHEKDRKSLEAHLAAVLKDNIEAKIKGNSLRGVTLADTQGRLISGLKKHNHNNALASLGANASDISNKIDEVVRMIGQKTQDTGLFTRITELKIIIKEQVETEEAALVITPIHIPSTQDNAQPFYLLVLLVGNNPDIPLLDIDAATKELAELISKD
ncbi:MAG: hypothetical protein D3916_15045 [Candidatus Electrothrix sp. MAN1_4]|nr:hypothetical protein [Candidatus Electrothrix sp. MAN1_4]